MAGVKWIKIVTDIFDDEKILIIESMPEADAIIVIWFKLLCLAGKQNNSGVFILNDRIPYTDEMFAAIFRRPIATVRLALKTFEKLGMVEIVNGAMTIPNWEKHQTLDAYERKKESDRLRMQQKRAEQRKIAGRIEEASKKSRATVALPVADQSPDVVPLEEDIEIDKEGEKEGEIESNREIVENNASCAEPPDSGRSTHPAKPKPTPSEFNIPLNDGSFYNVPQENIEFYKQNFPGVDVEQQLRNMIAWSREAGPNRKTERGVKRFIANWLIREQDKSRKGGRPNGANRGCPEASPQPVYGGETII